MMDSETTNGGELANQSLIQTEIITASAKALAKSQTHEERMGTLNHLSHLQLAGANILRMTAFIIDTLLCHQIHVPYPLTDRSGDELKKAMRAFLDVYEATKKDSYY